MKSRILILVAAGMTVLLAGCNKSNNEGGMGTNSVTEPNTPAPMDTNAAPSAEPNMPPPMMTNSSPTVETNTNSGMESNTSSTMATIKAGAVNAWEKAKEVTTNAAIQTWTDIKSLGSSTNYSYDQKDEFVTNAQEDLADLDQKMQSLSNKVASAGDTVKTAAQPKLDSLQSQRAQLDQKLDAVKNATQDNWNAAKSDFASSYDQVKASVKEAWQWVDQKLSP